MNFNDIFEYSEQSPSGLIWKIDIYSGENYTNLRVKKGSVAGSNKSTKKYWVVIHKGKCYRAHRIVWTILKGEIPEGMHVDHIDRNKSNNRIENLRLVSNTVNKRNSGKYSNNKTGVTGVRKIVMNGVLYFSTTWSTIDGKRKAAYFNTKKYGYEEAFQMACLKRNSVIEHLNFLGAGYTETHGK